MKNFRLNVLLTLLILALLGVVSRPVWESYLESTGTAQRATLPFPDPPPPLPGVNSISEVQVSADDQGRWILNFDYFYTGAPSPALIRIDVTRGQDPQHQQTIEGGDSVRAQRGAHHVTRQLNRPAVAAAITSNGVLLRLVHIGQDATDLLSRQTMAEISWPDALTASIDEEIRAKGPDTVLQQAVTWIDEGTADKLRDAKRHLDHLLLKYPQVHPAYLELARIAMRSNWSPEGLRLAEGYIASARQLAPEDPNVWILEGYVYTYQGRYKEAERLFVAASKTDTPNLWLWTNWGELHNLQGKTTLASQMFRKAIDQPPPGNTYDRARQKAYEVLIEILDKRRQLDEVEALQRRRFQDYGTVACYGIEYALFLLLERGNAAAAIELASRPALAQCHGENTNTKEVLGLAHYVAWAAAPAAERPELLNRARVYSPYRTKLIYQLASSDHSVGALKELLAAGEPIDQPDTRNMTALAYALSYKAHDIAARLLRLRGRPDVQIGEAGLPVALIPVLADDYQGIRLLRRYGVDYARIKYRDQTAVDHARRTGNRKLLEALGASATSMEQRL